MSKTKKLIWIPIALVAVIAVAVLVLSFVKVNPLESNFGGYSSVELWKDGSQFPGKVDDGVDLTEKTVKDGLATTDFSIMQAMLEGKFSYDPNLQFKVTDGKEDEEVTIGSEGIKNYTQGEGGYMLKFFYDEEKTIEVSGKSIHYDQMILIITESNGEVRDMVCIPYCSKCVYNDSYVNEYEKDENGNIIGHIGHGYYLTNVLTVKMNTSRFINTVKEILD